MFEIRILDEYDAMYMVLKLMYLGGIGGIVCTRWHYAKIL